MFELNVLCSICNTKLILFQQFSTQSSFLPFSRFTISFSFHPRFFTHPNTPLIPSDSDYISTSQTILHGTYSICQLPHVTYATAVQKRFHCLMLPFRKYHLFKLNTSSILYLTRSASNPFIISKRVQNIFNLKKKKKLCSINNVNLHTHTYKNIYTLVFH